MSRCCSGLGCSCCCCSRPSRSKAKTRTQHRFLKQLHSCGILSAQVIASAVLIAVGLWLIIRLPDPEVHVTGFELETFNSNTPNNTLLHYNFTLHNPDLYKSLQYDVIVVRMTFSHYATKYGITVNFLEDGRKIHHGPKQTTLLYNHTSNFTDDSVGWNLADMVGLKTFNYYIYLRFVMEVRFLVFNKVIATRQMMRVGEIYFNKKGKAFIHHRGGLMLK